MTCRPAVFLAVLIAISAASCAGVADERRCYSLKETRDAIRENGLPEPLAVFRTIASGANASILGVVLCRDMNRLVYELKLLGRDGRITRSVVDPFGRPLGSP